MKRFDKSMGTIRYVLPALFILLLPLGYYFLYHIPAKQSYYTSRNLRLLADISSNVSNRLSGYQGWLDKLALDNNYIKKDFNQRYRENISRTPEQQLTIPQLFRKVAQDFKPNFKRIENLDVDNFSITPQSQPRSDSLSFTMRSMWSTVKIYSDRIGDASQLHLIYNGYKRNEEEKYDNYDLELNGSINLRHIIAPLLHEEVFDNILIFENDENRRVIYQQNRDEFIAVRIDTLSSRINSMFMSGYDQVTFSNSEYNVYSHPLQIKNIVSPDSLQSLDKVTPLNCTIVGLVDASRFSSDSRTISHYKISLFLFVVLLIVISLPLIKLKFITPLEEITKFDLVSSIFALIFGAGIITFLTITIYSNRDDKRLIDSHLVTLNKEIDMHLCDELDAVYEQADQISAAFADNNRALFNKIIDDKERNGIVTSCMTDSEVWGFPDSVFPHFTQIAWLDPGSGKQVLKIDPDSTTTPLVNVSSREYFTKIKNKNGWLHKLTAHCDLCDQQAEKQYYIQPIISLTTGERADVITFNDLHLGHIQAVSHRFKSLRKVVMPRSFGFCIVDENGKALFHSQDDKSLREDFIKEADNSPLLQSALYSRTNAHMTLSYHGQDHRLYVSPIENTDWRLITFVSLATIHAAELSAAVLAFALFMALLVWYIVLFFLFRFLFSFKSFSWLLPHRDMETCYQLYFISLFILSGIYFTITFVVGPTANLILAFWVAPGNLMFMYLLLQFRAICSVLKRLKLNIPRLGRYITLLVLLIASVVLFHIEKVSISYLVFFLFLTLFFLSDSIKMLFEKYRMPSFYVSYVASIIAFVIMTSIVPTIAFFRLAYDDEMKLLIKNVQLDFVHNYAERTNRLEDKYRKIIIGRAENDLLADTSAAENPNMMRAVMSDSIDIYIDAFQHSTWHIEPKNSIAKEKADALADQLATLRRTMQIVDPLNWQLHKNSAQDSAWYWGQIDTTLQLTLTLSPTQAKQIGLSSISSRLQPFKPPKDSQWAIAMMGLIILTGLVIIYFIHKVIILDITLPERKEADDTPFNHNVIYIGPHGSGKSNVVDQIPEAYKINFRTIDDLQDFVEKIGMGEKIPEKIKTVILDHFDVDIESREISEIKLKLIKRLVATYKKNVVIVSSVDPIKFIENQKSIKDKEAWRGAWVHALNSFTRVYHNVRSPGENFRKTVIDYSTAHTDVDDPAMWRKNEDFCETLVQECNHSSFLRQVGMELLQRFDFANVFFNKKAFFSEVLQRSTTYYESMWQDCTIEEKITLVNLVKNRFFVRKDSDFIRILLQKGLIIRDGHFHCFNNSFELFVRKAESQKDVRAWRQQNAQNWGHVRTLVISLLIAVALFIFLTQREMFNRWIALLSTFAAGVPVVLRMLSVVNWGGRTQKTDGGSESAGT